MWYSMYYYFSDNKMSQIYYHRLSGTLYKENDNVAYVSYKNSQGHHQAN